MKPIRYQRQRWRQFRASQQPAYRITLLAVIFLFSLGQSQASTASVSVQDLELSGFLSIGAARLDTDKVVYGDLDDEFGYDFDSVIGVQLNLPISERISVTSQIVANGFSNNEDRDDYKPYINWAYVAYQIDPSWKARLGRMQTPFYAVSDYIEVGLAYPWVRPPIDVYNLSVVPFSSFDGIDLIYTGDFFDWEMLFQSMAGRYHGKTDLYKVKTDKMFGFFVSLSQGDWSINYSGTRHYVDFDYEGIEVLAGILESLAVAPEAGFGAFGDIRNLFIVDDDIHDFHAMSINWEGEAINVRAETYVIESQATFGGEVEGWYLSTAYNLGKFTPYVTFGENETQSLDDISDAIAALDASVTSNPVPIGGITAAAGVNAASIAADLSNLRSRTLGIGVRYFLYDRLALKAEALQVKPLDGSAGPFTSATTPVGQKATDIPNDVMIYSITLDWVF